MEGRIDSVVHQVLKCKKRGKEKQNCFDASANTFKKQQDTESQDREYIWLITLNTVTLNYI